MALRDQPYLPLYVQDVLTDEKLSCCSLSSIGVYFKVICVLHKSETYGGILFKQIPKQNFSTWQYFVWVLSKQTGIQEKEINDALDELTFFGVMQIDENYNGNGIPFLYQKRMVKDCEISIKRALSAKKGGGNPQLKKEKNKEILFKQTSKQTDKQNTEYEYTNENEYVNDNKGIVKGKKSKDLIIPSLHDFQEYFQENGFSKELAERAWKGYDAAGWKDSKGSPVKSWKQKCQHVWFTDKNSQFKIANQTQSVRSQTQTTINVHDRVQQLFEQEEGNINA